MAVMKLRVIILNNNNAEANKNVSKENTFILQCVINVVFKAKYRKTKSLDISEIEKRYYFLVEPFYHSAVNTKIW